MKEFYHAAAVSLGMYEPNGTHFVLERREAC
jgi:hypothetical protein